jgi:hypothetical protein
MTLEIVEPYSNADKVYHQIHVNLGDWVKPSSVDAHELRNTSQEKSKLS